MSLPIAIFVRIPRRFDTNQPPVTHVGANGYSVGHASVNGREAAFGAKISPPHNDGHYVDLFEAVAF